MEVSSKEILHIANLASLNLSKEEVEKYKKDLQDILNFANIVNKANIDGIEETIITNDGHNVFRKDEVGKKYSREELLQNVEEQQFGMFKIPKVM